MQLRGQEIPLRAGQRLLLEQVRQKKGYASAIGELLHRTESKARVALSQSCFFFDTHNFSLNAPILMSNTEDEKYALPAVFRYAENLFDNGNSLCYKSFWHTEISNPV